VLPLRVRLKITGTVQGVGFRPFIYRLAVKNGLTGYVCNIGGAGVEVFLEGNKINIENFIQDLSAEKPSLLQIDKIVKKLVEGKEEYSTFTIGKSLQTVKFSGAMFPSDISICDKCLKELESFEDKRFNYFFITCTECGPRFSILEHWPYDRENTTMCEFSMCNFCQKEYTDPLNRRFHAQTVACSNCGPQIYLTTNTGELVKTLNPVQEAGKLLSEGKIVAIKGYGGFHIACSATLEEPLLKLRKSKSRKAKPFAIMARDFKAIEQIANINFKERELLMSPSRPIVLLNKKIDDYNLSPLISPNLHNIGVMLPYSGLHHMLFDKNNDNTFVMTSANFSNQPIINDNIEALHALGDTVDYFLFHNRRIAHRCDDSIIRVHKDKQVFLRRSRGYVPAPIKMKYKSLRHTIGFGGELNNTSCILREDKAFISQHIGDIENIETRTFFVDATEHLLRLTNSKIKVLACDLHPKFTTTALADEWANSLGLPLVRVQHHHAHAAALMGEHGLNELVGIICDGYGYGANGEAWGGEVLMCQTGLAGFSRLGHLEPQPLLGGDVSSMYPVRVAAGFLHKAGVDVEEFLLQNKAHLAYGEVEANFVLDQLRRGDGGVGVVQSSSCGRVLDAVSAVLGVCCQRSYEGEAAMKLESVALGGVDVLELEPVLHGGVLETSNLLGVVYENKGKLSLADLAYSVHTYLARGLGALAVEKACAHGLGVVGFSGGVAGNEILAGLLRKNVESAGLEFVVHKDVPVGDGGVSFGQAVVAGFSDF
jgi:hydrogenase maturation protein HypF